MTFSYLLTFVILKINGQKAVLSRGFLKDDNVDQTIDKCSLLLLLFSYYSNAPHARHDFQSWSNRC